MVRIRNKTAWSLALKVNAHRAETSVSADHGVYVSGEDAAEVNPGFSSASKIVNTVNLVLCTVCITAELWSGLGEGSSALWVWFLVTASGRPVFYLPLSLLAGWTETKSLALFYNIVANLLLLTQKWIAKILEYIRTSTEAWLDFSGN